MAYRPARELSKKTSGTIMADKEEKKYLIIIAGPTASGKTKTAISLARHFRTEIISADSRQFYREMVIGTAAPTKEELELAQHHFTGHLSVTQPYDVYQYEKDVMELLTAKFNQYQTMILAGGSGLYIDAVGLGMDDLPDTSPGLREHIKNLEVMYGLDFIRNYLKILDFEYYEKVDKNNPVRMRRAIEVCISTGKKFSSFQRQQFPKRSFSLIWIGLTMERPSLYQRIEQRTDAMLEKGFIEEAEALYPFREYNALKTLGYRELFQYFNKDISLEQAIKDIKTNTRRYAKRQLTWFRRNKKIRWFHPENISEMIHYIENQIPEG